MRIDMSSLQQGSDGEHTSAEDENPEEEETSDADKDADLELEGQESEEQEPDPGEDLFGARFFDDPKTPQEEPDKETR